MATHNEIERVAAAMNALRPEWTLKSLITHLSTNHANRPFRDLAAAAAWIAADRDSRVPSRLSEPGPWWHVGNDTGPATPTPVRGERCRRHYVPQPCPSCEQRRAATPEDMAAIRMAARAARRMT